MLNMMPDINFRMAKEENISSLIALIADNEIGSLREDIADLSSYIEAFHEISKSANDNLIVMEMGGEIIGMAHLTILRHLSLKGIRRGNIGTFHIKSTYRNKGYGTILMNYVIDFSKKCNIKNFQLTTNKKRFEAKLFYEKFGFVASHEGMKLSI